MENQKIVFWRNFLLRTFLIGLLLGILLLVLTGMFWQPWSSMIQANFSVQPERLGELFANSILNLRLFLLFILLAPAVALHSLVKKN